MTEANKPLQTIEGRKGLPCESVWYPYNFVVHACIDLVVEDMVRNEASLVEVKEYLVHIVKQTAV